MLHAWNLSPWWCAHRFCAGSAPLLTWLTNVHLCLNVTAWLVFLLTRADSFGTMIDAIFIIFYERVHRDTASLDQCPVTIERKSGV